MSETIDRPKFRETDDGKKHKDIPEQYDIVQLKMDGIFGCMKISTWTVGHILTHR